MQPNNQKPRVSIFTICYNQERYIRRCLEGIVSQQTGFPFEAIVIDDASTDSTPQIIEEYARQYPDIIKPVLLKENWHRQGKSKLQEIFLPEAKGEFVAFCEGDDFWTSPLKLRLQVDFLDSHPEFAACAHPYSLLYENGRCGVPPRIVHGALDADDAFLFSAIQTATLLGRLDILRRHMATLDRYRSRITPNVDTFFFATYLAYGGIWALPEMMSVYRHTQGSISREQKRLGQTRARHESLLHLYSEIYPAVFSGICEKYRCLCLLEDSSAEIAARNYRHGLALKLRAFMRKPLWVAHLYYLHYTHG